MQHGIPVEVTPGEIAREKSLGGSIALCAKAAGLEPKQITIGGKPVDKGQWSRWLSDGEGVIWDKLTAVMDQCGNDAPVQWMLMARGYDLHSLRRLETETERENRKLREENSALRRVLLGGAA